MKKACQRVLRSSFYLLLTLTEVNLLHACALVLLHRGGGHKASSACA